MRISSRLVSVVFSHLALLCGLVALPTVGQSGSLSVLNWIPPTPLTGSPCDFFTYPATTPPPPAGTCPTSIAGAKEVTGTIPMWLSTDTASTVLYGTPPQTTQPIAMVGKDPSVPKTGATTIDTKIIPIVFTGSTSTASYVFDPENTDVCSPKKTPALNMVQGSPVFKPNKLLVGPMGVPGVSLGTYQFGSQFQRANFGTYTIKTGSNATPVSPNCDISLSQVLSNQEEKKGHSIAIIDPAASPSLTALPYTINGMVQTDSDWCAPLAIIDGNELDTLLQTQIIPALKPAGITPSTLPIFLLTNVAMSYTVIDTTVTPNTSTTYCCILGYHNAYLSLTTGATANKLQTYIVANYDTTGGTVNSGTANPKSYTGAFPTAPNIVALANMVAGWINNPTTLNPTHSFPASTSSGTATALEVAFPQCPTGLGGKLTTITMPNKLTYSVQDLAFKQWFYDGATTTGFNGLTSPAYSMFGNLPAPNPSLGCPLPP